VQEQYNAFSLIAADAALAMAKESTARWRSGAPLSAIDGVPTTIKDIVWVKDWAVRYGSRTTSSEPCVQDAPSVKRLRAARDLNRPDDHSRIRLEGDHREPVDRGHAQSLESADHARRLVRRRRGRGRDRSRRAAHRHRRRRIYTHSVIVHRRIRIEADVRPGGCLSA
jgi:hypothetical protein